MNDNPVKHYLKQSAADAIPADVDLWPRIQCQLQQKPRHVPEPRYQPLALVVAAIAVIALLVVLALPQTHARALAFLQFFTAAPQDEIAIPTGDQSHPMQTFPTLDDAEAFVGWDAKRFVTDPEGMLLDHIEASQDKTALRIYYVAEGGGGQLVLSQGVGARPSDSAWETIPDGVVEAVTIGGHSGEYARGGFVAVNPADQEAKWVPNVPMQRLRWQAETMWLEITKQGDSHFIEYLDKDGLIALASTLQ